MATTIDIETAEETKTKKRTWPIWLGVILGTVALCSLIWFFALWQHIGPTPGQCGGSGTPCAAATTPPPAPVPTVVVVSPPPPPVVVAPLPSPVIACNVCEANALASVPTVDQDHMVLVEARSACAAAGCR